MYAFHYIGWHYTHSWSEICPEEEEEAEGRISNVILVNVPCVQSQAILLLWMFRQLRDANNAIYMGPPTVQLRGWGCAGCWENLTLSEETGGVTESLFALTSF